jgi:hypothetical protein
MEFASVQELTDLTWEDLRIFSGKINEGNDCRLSTDGCSKGLCRIQS